MQFLKLDEVITMTTLSRGSIYRLMAENKFPKQHEIADRRSVWLKSDIEAWMEEKIGDKNDHT